MFEKAVEAKKEQREKEKEWKQKKKDRDRHLYHLRHAKDYEVRMMLATSVWCGGGNSVNQDALSGPLPEGKSQKGAVRA